MHFRTSCSHEFIEHDWGGKHCKKCKLRFYDIGKHDELLNAAEAEHGPFGARHGMFKAMVGVTGLNHFMLLDKDGKWIAYALGAACYYQLQEYAPDAAKSAKSKAEFIWDWPFGGSTKKTPAFKKTTLRRIGGLKGWASRFYTWAANESAWKDCFVVKDFAQAYEDGILYTTRVESEHLMSIMSGIRYIGEYPERVKAWDAAMEYTGSGTFSLLAAHFFQLSDKKGMAISAPHSSNHAMWYMPNFDAKLHTKRFLDGKLLPTGGTLKDRWSWSQCYRQWGELPKPTRNANTGYWDDPQPKNVYKLPDTKGKQVKDMFGGWYEEKKDVPVEDWIDQFEEEVLKWELKSPS